jgi:alpha/beta hydrolase family protein
MKKSLRWGLVICLALLAVAIGGFVLYANLHVRSPLPEAIAALQSTDAVTVTADKWLVFTPKDTDPQVGLVLYPGGYVDARAYAPMARDIAGSGYLVVVIPMPFNLAVFGSGKAADVFDAFPEIERWSNGKSIRLQEPR